MLKKIKITIALLALLSLGWLLKKEYKAYNERRILAEFRKIVDQEGKVPDNWDEKYKDIKIKNKYKVVFVTNNGGEYSYTEYFKYAAEKIGWEVKIYIDHMHGYEQDILEFDPDFIVFGIYAYDMYKDMKITAHRSRKYLVNFMPIESLAEQNKVSKEDPYKAIGSFYDLVYMSHGVLTVPDDMAVFKGMFNKLNKPFNGISTLCTAPYIENKPAEPKNLMWIGMGWDKFRSSGSYKEFITLLSDNIPMKVYGSYRVFSYLKPNVYDGYVTPGIDNIKAIQKNGIYLLTHSDLHNAAGNPSVRLFEAAAANAIIISDKNPFTIKYFGDSVLYFDQNAAPKVMYEQVKAHFDWIKANPEKAKAMAARAHKIFLDNFTVDKDLARIARMHEYVLEQEKKMKMSHPLVY